MSKVDSGNGLKVQGFIELELVSTKDNTRRVYHNTITNGGKQFLLTRCVGSLLGIGGDTFGNLGAIDSVSLLRDGSRFSARNTCINNVLLNLGSKLDGLTAESSFVNLFDSNLFTASGVVGRGSNYLLGVGSTLGKLDLSKGEYVADPFTCAKRWKYDIGVASGTIDAVAMMPGRCLESPYFPGLTYKKCIDKVNIKADSFVSLSTQLLPPGVPGFTSNDEILLNFDYEGCSTWKYNISTGEVTALGPTDPFFVLPADACDYYVEGNYLYYLVREDAGSPTSTNKYVRCYRVALDNTGSVSSIGQGNYVYYNVGARFCSINGELYFTMFSTVASYCKQYKLNKSGDYYTSVTASSLDDMGVVVPTGLEGKPIGIGSYGSQYIVYLPTFDEENPGNNTNVSKYGGCSSGLVVTNLADIPNSIVGKYSNIGTWSIPFYKGSNKGFVGIGFCRTPFTAEVDTTGQITLNYTDGIKYFYDDLDFSGYVDTSSLSTLNTLESGAYITLEGWSTDVLSFVKLTQPITKSDTDILYVSYGYKII